MMAEGVSKEDERIAREQRRKNYEKAIEALKEGKRGIPFVLSNNLNDYYGEAEFKNNL